MLASFANLLNAQDIPTVDDVNKNEPQLPSQQEKLSSDNLKLEQNDKVEKIDEDQILKIIDIFGREVRPKKNMILFYIYNDQSVKKIIIK